MNLMGTSMSSGATLCSDNHGEQKNPAHPRSAGQSLAR